MLLRPRQKELVARAVAALHQHGNTLAVAPTGAGKTIMLSATVGEMAKASPTKACVLAHRDELAAQNVAKFSRINPHLSTSIVDASQKSWQGDTTFAMVQTLSRENNLATMPPLDLLVIDEAHHARSETYLRIISHAKSLNPNLKVFGVTATPNRGDKKGLRPIFSNVCDQITVNELIASGHLVPPRTFVMDVDTQQKLRQVKQLAGDYDMEEVAEIMDTRPVNDAVVAHWQEKAKDRQTVVFCSTVYHACHVQKSFIQKGITTVLVEGGMPTQERKQALNMYATGKARVIVNVAVLTEGWDHPPTSCVVLLRPASFKSTMIQMIGRGLRPLNPEEYAGLIKNDCLVLDFGTATLAHGSIEQAVELDDRRRSNTQDSDDLKSPQKFCPACGGEVPLAVMVCPLCSYMFLPKQDKGQLLGTADFVLREIDILHRSSFLWVPLDHQQHSYMAVGFHAWGGVFFREGRWYAIGALQKQKPRLLVVGDKTVCSAAANDWMNLHESDDSAKKSKGWLKLTATQKQLAYLPEHRGNYGLSRYKASTLINLKFNAYAISQIISNAGEIGAHFRKEVAYG